jgi:hypothetical protein
VVCCAAEAILVCHFYHAALHLLWVRGCPGCRTAGRGLWVFLVSKVMLVCSSCWLCVAALVRVGCMVGVVSCGVCGVCDTSMCCAASFQCAAGGVGQQSHPKAACSCVDAVESMVNSGVCGSRVCGLPYEDLWQVFLYQCTVYVQRMYRLLTLEAEKHCVA